MLAWYMKSRLSLRAQKPYWRSVTRKKMARVRWAQCRVRFGWPGRFGRVRGRAPPDRAGPMWQRAGYSRLNVASCRRGTGLARDG